MLGTASSNDLPEQARVKQRVVSPVPLGICCKPAPQCQNAGTADTPCARKVAPCYTGYAPLKLCHKQIVRKYFPEKNRSENTAAFSNHRKRCKYAGAHVVKQQKAQTVHIKSSDTEHRSPAIMSSGVWIRIKVRCSNIKYTEYHLSTSTEINAVDYRTPEVLPYLPAQTIWKSPPEAPRFMPTSEGHVR